MPHAAYLHSQVALLRQLLSMCISVCLLISETDVWTIGFDLPGSGDGGIPHHSNVIRLHKPIRMMPVLLVCRYAPP